MEARPLSFYESPVKLKIGSLVKVGGELFRVVREPTMRSSIWMHVVSPASEEEKTVWEVMEV